MIEKIESQYETAEQQKGAALLGMWIFIGTEILFFGGLFLSYTYYRVRYPQVLEQVGPQFNVALGTINTAILLTSSYFMAMAIHSIENARQRAATRYLAATVGLGLIFLAFKAREYIEDSTTLIASGPDERVMRLFFWLYYVMTGLHALHVTIGVGVISWILRRTVRGDFSSAYSTPMEVTGLYWHFVDVVWIFLYPLLYLIGRHS